MLSLLKICTFLVKDASILLKERLSPANKPMKCFSEHIVIGSRKITDNKQLLLELESRLNLTVVERDYSPLYNSLGKVECYWQPDIIVDERTCVVLIHDHEIVIDAKRDVLQRIISSMAIKCLECFIIVTFFDFHSNR